MLPDTTQVLPTPFAGGFVDENEGLDTAARRELEEETGVIDRAMVQTGAYGVSPPAVRVML